MLRLIVPAAAAALIALCTGGLDAVGDQLSGGSSGSGGSGGSSGSSGSGGASGSSSGSGSGGAVQLGARPAEQGSGASNLIRQVASGGGPAPGITAMQCNDLTAGGPVNGPDCITAEIKCGETIVGHTRGGVNRYNTRFYERNTCWPGTRNHNGGDERVYMFVADKSPRFQAGEERQRISIYFDTPCADLTFTWMQYDVVGKCPAPDAAVRRCDSMNPFNRKRRENVTVDRGEVLYFLVEGGDEHEGAFSISLECGT